MVARLNVEESLFTDPIYIDLCVALNSEPKALGWWVIVARLAQSYWKYDKGLIPKSVYKFRKIPRQLIEVGMVREMENGYYFRGSESNFAWIFSKVENGKRGGRPRKVVENKQDSKTYGITETAPPQNPLTLTPTPTHNNLNMQKKAKGKTASKKGPISDLSGIDQIDEVLNNVTQKTQKSWLQLYYDAQWIKSEISKCVIYFEEKEVKSWGKTISNWLSSPYSEKPKPSMGKKIDDFFAAQGIVGYEDWTQ